MLRLWMRDCVILQMFRRKEDARAREGEVFMILCLGYAAIFAG